VTERPDLVFGAFLVLAATAAAVLLGALIEAGVQGVAGVAAVSAGLVSACILFAIELRQFPPALVVVSLIAVASGTALLRALRSVWREQRLLRALPVVALADSEYGDLLPSRPAGVDICVLHSHRQGAFCAGLLRPRIVVTTALLDGLDDEERQAVLVHELSHAGRRGPLKLAFGRLAVRTLFWVPVLRDLADRYLLLTELAADRAAVAATSPAALAGALSQVLTTPAFVGSVGLADHAAARIDRLFDARAKLPRLVSPARAALTLLAMGTVAALVYSSPHLSSSESMQLHTMSVTLLAHHVQARLIGFAITALTVSIVLAGARRLVGRRPRRGLRGLRTEQRRST
jgi:Zn-dependent protease with chaperone function